MLFPTPRQSILVSNRKAPMVEERSPCLQCERLKKNKLECAASCEELDKFKEELQHCPLNQEDSTDYRIPGLERTRSYTIDD